MLALGFCLFTVAHALGSFHLPSFITSDFDLGTHSFGFASDPNTATTAEKAAAIGLYFGESLAFRLPDDVVGSSTVLEVTVGAGLGTDQMNVDFKLTLSDGSSQVLYQYYHYSSGYQHEFSDLVLIPLDGANTSRFTVLVERFAESIGDPANVPAAYLGAIAATWVVGQVHAEEQVVIVDLESNVFNSSGPGGCERSDIEVDPDSSVKTFIRGAKYYFTGQSHASTCSVALAFSDVVSQMQAPVFLNVNGFKEVGDYGYPSVFITAQDGSTQRVIKQIQDSDDYESAPFSLQIPSEYLQAVLKESANFSHISNDNLPYTSVLTLWEGYVARFAKLQGTGSSAQVVDLSTGSFTAFDGAQKSSSSNDVDNAALDMTDPYVFPWSDKGGAFTFTAPISDAPYYLEVLHARLDSDGDLTFVLRFNTSGEVIVNGTMIEYEDDKSSVSRTFFYIPKSTDGLLTLSWTHAGDDGIYFSPFFVARFPRFPYVMVDSSPGLAFLGSALLAIAVTAAFT